MLSENTVTRLPVFSPLAFFSQYVRVTVTSGTGSGQRNALVVRVSVPSDISTINTPVLPLLSCSQYAFTTVGGGGGGGATGNGHVLTSYTFFRLSSS